uniref:Uncharacterized protein n=1 Tax=Panagrolaimus superbus TaxID=310955 RepID=A0A914YUR1_9BILA
MCTAISVVDAKSKIINGKIGWSGGPSIKQLFLLHPSIMYYIAKNPSTPEVYNKLIQSCKYFFEKMAIFVASDLYTTGMYEKTKICLYIDCRHHTKCCINVSLNKLSTKIWVTNILGLDKENILTFSSLIFPKLFRWNNIQLDGFSDNIMYDDFKKVASFLTDFSFWRSQIINNDGSVVMLDKILEITPNIKEFYFSFWDDISMINPATMKNICKLKNLQNVESFRLFHIPEVFNVDDLSTFVKNHQNTKIVFDFVGEISEEYKIQLDALIDTVIESEVHNCRIQYRGQNEEKYKIMNELYHL